MIATIKRYQPATDDALRRAAGDPRAGGTARRPADSFWRGLDFFKLVRTLSDCLAARKWRPDPPKSFLFSRGGAVSTGIVVRGTDFEVAGGLPSLAVVATNVLPYGRRYYLGLSFGDSAVVIDRWASMGRKGRYDVLTEAEESVDRWASGAAALTEAAGRLGSKFLFADEATLLLNAAARKGLLPSNRIAKVDAAFRDANRQTAWGLLVLFGRDVTACSPPRLQPDRMYGFFKLVNAHCKPDKKGD